MQRNERSAVAAIIERNGHFLLGKRSPHKASGAGVWHAIIGSIEPGETPAQAIEREVLEETGLVVRAIACVESLTTRDGRSRIHWWRVETVDEREAAVLGAEHTELRWVTLSEMRQLDPIFPEDLALFTRASGLGPQSR